jgi:hypothetical protein
VSIDGVDEMFIVPSRVATVVFHVHLYRDFGLDCYKYFTVWQTSTTSFGIQALLCLRLQDVAYEPKELTIPTHKCEPDAGTDVVASCER